MTYLDTIIRAVESRILRSGVLERSTLTASVSAVGTDGTFTATRDGDTIPRVRCLGTYAPAVGHSVQIHKAAGGWICLGRSRTTNRPTLQSGTVSVAGPAVAGQWSANVAVTFPAPFATTPRVTATPNAGAPDSGGTTALSWAVADVTATGFNIRQLRGSTGTTIFGWIATDL